MVPRHVCLILGGACLLEATAFAPLSASQPTARNAVADQVMTATGASSRAQSRLELRTQPTPWSVLLLSLAAAGAVAARATSRSRGVLANGTTPTPCAVDRPMSSAVSLGAHKKPTKKGRKFIVLECVEQRQMVKDGVPGAGGPRGGVSRYFTEKNVRNTPNLLELKKYNKYLGRHTVHRELKK